MNINKYTEKAQEAVRGAQQLAEKMSHAQIEPEHLLVALAEQPEGIVPEVLKKMGADPAQISRSARELLAKISQAYGGSEPSLSPRLKLVTDQAQAEADRLKDEYVSTEHLLLAIDGRERAAPRCAAPDAARPHARRDPGSADQRPRIAARDDQNPEGTYQALERYGRDLTELARRASSTR